MKAIARSYFWWYNLETDIEKKARSCQVCKSNQNKPPPAPLYPWVWPTTPWSTIHINFAGPFLQWRYLIIVDWPEVIELASTSYYLRDKRRILIIWTTSTVGVRQWSTNYSSGVPRVSEESNTSSLHNTTLPPKDKLRDSYPCSMKLTVEDTTASKLQEAMAYWLTDLHQTLLPGKSCYF